MVRMRFLSIFASVLFLVSDASAAKLGNGSCCKAEGSGSSSCNNCASGCYCLKDAVAKNGVECLFGKKLAATNLNSLMIGQIKHCGSTCCSCGSKDASPSDPVADPVETIAPTVD